MVIRKYVGRTQTEALAKVKRDLGSEAVILETHVSRRRAWFGLKETREYEVWAGKGAGVVADYPAPRVAKAYGAPAPSPDTQRIAQQIGELKSILLETKERLSHPDLKGLEPELFEHYVALTSRRVSEDLARELILGIRKEVGPAVTRQAVAGAIRRTVRALIRCADGIAFVPGRSTRVAFIGPTGVGKTTTIAKLMAIYTYRRKSVAIVTCDTLRIAATDQIRRVAELVGVPVRVAARPEEAREAVDEFASRDLVLIDTAGRGQRNEARMQELRSLLDAVKPDERHLVVSVGTNRDTLQDVLTRFGAVGADRVVLTKMDEAVQSGIVLDVLATLKHQLSFITTGQDIPADIEVADADRLAALVLGAEAV